MSKKKATKKAVGNSVVKVGGRLGSTRTREAMEKAESGSGGNSRAFHNLPNTGIGNASPHNIVVIVDPSVYYVHRHYKLFTREGKKGEICGIHAKSETDECRIIDLLDEDKRLNPFFEAVEHCPVCATMLESYKENKQNPSPRNDKLKEAMNKVRAEISFNVRAVAGRANVVYKGDEQIVTPYFSPSDLTDVRYLPLTHATYKKLDEAIKSSKNLPKIKNQETGEMETDISGIPINFRRGNVGGKKIGKNLVSQVIGVDFFPKQKIPVSKFGDENDWPDFSDIADYDEERMNKTHKAWLDFLPDILAGKVEDEDEEESTKKESSKKGGKKTSKKTGRGR